MVERNDDQNKQKNERMPQQGTEKKADLENEESSLQGKGDGMAGRHGGTSRDVEEE